MAEEDIENMTPEQIAQLQKDNCIFCKIISGEIPSKKVYEDTDFVGILDINPASDGHVILLPKQHFQIMPQMPPELVGTMGIAVSKISATIIRSFKCTGTSVFIANGAVAGQRAPHFILHIIPRSDDDNIALNPTISEIDDKTFDIIRDKVHMHLSPRQSPDLKLREMPSEEKLNADTEEIKEDKIREEKSKHIKQEDQPSGDPNDPNNPQNLNDSFTKKQSDNDDDLEDEIRDEMKDEISSKKNRKPTNKSSQTESKSNSNSVDYDKLARLFG